MSEITLLPATPSDIDTLARLAGDSFEHDRQTILKSTVGTYNHAEGMKGGLEAWINIHSGPASAGDEMQRRCEVLKAVDESSGEILGWVCWGFRGFKTTPPGPVVVGDGTVPEEEQTAEDTGKEMTSIERLERLTDEDMERMIETVLMPEGTKCMYIISICVPPAHQGKGVGKALISYGARRADEAGVHAWVHSSEAGAGMFEKQGFEEVERLEVDLDEYCDGVSVPKGLEKMGDKETGWGEYVFRYMKRMPMKK